MNELNELLKKYEEAYIENNPACENVLLEIYAGEDDICGVISDDGFYYRKIIIEFNSYDDLIEMLKG